MQVAALLLWALRLSPVSPVGSFWQQYRQLLPGSVQECSSLLVWSKDELEELQVRVSCAPYHCQYASFVGFSTLRLLVGSRLRTTLFGPVHDGMCLTMCRVNPLLDCAVLAGCQLAGHC
jgi:hypothetical protein